MANESKSIFFHSRRTTSLSENDMQARAIYSNVNSEIIALGSKTTLATEQANDFLSRLDESLSLSSVNQWFHYAAQKLKLDIIFYTNNRASLNDAFQLTDQQILDGYNALKTSSLFSSQIQAEREQVETAISTLQSKVANNIINGSSNH